MILNNEHHQNPKDIYVVRVFPAGENGGNPAPICLDCDDLSSETMRRTAAYFGHESGFVMRPSKGCHADFRFRFFVPNHEMEMCGHATIGALWVLRDLGHISSGNYKIETASGLVKAKVTAFGPISISQPVGTTKNLNASSAQRVLDVLNLSENDLASSVMFNAKTSRTKTLIAVKSPDRLHKITPDYPMIGQVCAEIDSTGLYPFARVSENSEFSARQFPRSSGYLEDAATGIAASALAFGLLKYGWVNPLDTIMVRQGEAMGCPSRMTIAFAIEEGKPVACWLSGTCQTDQTSTIPETAYLD